MLRSILTLLKLFVTVPCFEFAGAAAIVAGVWIRFGLSWALIAAGALALVKAFDLEVSKGRK